MNEARHKRPHWILNLKEQTRDEWLPRVGAQESEGQICKQQEGFY